MSFKCFLGTLVHTRALGEVLIEPDQCVVVGPTGRIHSVSSGSDAKSVCSTLEIEDCDIVTASVRAILVFHSGQARSRGVAAPAREPARRAGYPVLHARPRGHSHARSAGSCSPVTRACSSTCRSLLFVCTGCACTNPSQRSHPPRGPSVEPVQGHVYCLSPFHRACQRRCFALTPCPAPQSFAAGSGTSYEVGALQVYAAPLVAVPALACPPRVGSSQRTCCASVVELHIGRASKPKPAVSDST